MQSSEYIVPDQPAVAVQPSVTPSFDLPFILGLLRRDWFFPVIGCMIGLAAALTYITMTPSLYSSTARILLDGSVNRYLQTKNIIDEPVLNYADAGSQVHVLSSESVVVPVVRSMGLARDPEFVGRKALKSNELKWGLSSFIAGIKRALNYPQPDYSEETRERIAVETFLKRLTVYRADVPSVINVTFSSADRNKAAKIANAIAERYLEARYEAKVSSTRLAGQLLGDRLAELKRQAAEADQRLRQFKLTNNFMTSNKMTQSSDMLSDLNSQLWTSRAATAVSKTRLDVAARQIRGGRADTQVTDSQLILNLRLKYIEVSHRFVELQRRVGRRHAAVTKLRARMSDIRNAIQEEQQRIIHRYEREYEFAKARSKKLTAERTQLVVGVGGMNSQASIRMRELESASEAIRKTYDIALRNLNELGTKHGVVSQDARIITKAAAPLRKSMKKTRLVLGGSIGLGLLLGLGVVLGREFASGVIRTPRQVREITDAYCALVPDATIASGPSPGRLGEYVLEEPFSRFTEAYRSVRAVLIARRNSPNGGEVIGVVSPVGKEGKTTITMNLGALMASSRKRRVLVIDGDLHRRNLTNEMTPGAKEGLIEALEDPSRLSSLIIKMESSGLDVLPCPLANRLKHGAELLGSPQMETIVNMARDIYDFVIIEAPPVMSVVDVKMFEQHVDQFVLVLEWGTTTWRLMEEVLLEVKGIRDRLSCVVLNKVNVTMLKSIESYKGPRASDYYEG